MIIAKKSEFFIISLMVAVILLYALLVALAVSIIWAVVPRFSPIPYYPTQSQDLRLIIRTFGLKKGDILYDLGAGDGKVIIEAAKIKGVKVVGVEIHPLLVFVMLVKRFLHPHKENITVLWHDLFNIDITDATHIYLYVGPFVMKRVVAKVLGEMPPHLKQITSYMYPFQLKELPKGLTETVIEGEHPIYILKRSF